MAVPASRQSRGAGVDVGMTVNRLKRRFRLAVDDVEKVEIVDALLPHLLSMGNVAEAETYLAQTRARPPLIQALEAVVAVFELNHTRAKVLIASAIDGLENEQEPSITAKVWSRAATVAYYLNDARECERRALRAAAIAEDAHLPAIAAPVYSLLYNIHYSRTGDFQQARYYAERLWITGELAGSAWFSNMGRAMLYGLAAAAGDEVTIEQLDADENTRRLASQYREGFASYIGRALVLGWQENFPAMKAHLEAQLDGDTLESPGRALIHGLLALAFAATGEDDSGLSHARRAISLADLPQRTDVLYDGRLRGRGRIVGAAAAIILGETYRGKRALRARGALPAGTDEAALASALHDGSPVSLDSTGAAFPSIAGYARAIAVVARRRQGQRAPSLLTPTELTILRHIADGASDASIATESQIKLSTVRFHLKNIYAKLGVRSRLEAVIQAQRTGLMR